MSLAFPLLARVAASVLVALPLLATPVATSRAAEQPVTLNFRDADIDSVVGAFGHLMDKTFVIDPRVRGKITLETPKPVSKQQAYRLLQAVLRTQGFAVVDTGPLARVVPEAEAKLQGGPVASGRTPTVTNDQVITQVFTLNNESATNLVPVLRPLIAPNNTITAYPNNNSLVITDYASNIQRIGRIIASLDGPAAGDVEVVPLEHAVATDVAVTVNRLIDDGGRPAGPGAAVDAGQRVQILADTRINAVMIRSSSPAKMRLAKSLIARLDQPTSEQGGNIRVVYLRNAEATRLVPVLRAVLAGGDTGAGTGQQQTQNIPSALANASGNMANSPFGAAGGQGQQGGFGQPQGGLQTLQQPVTVTAGGATIAADPATNALVITAPEPVYRNIRGVIERLDVRRAQVYIESLIVEITDEKAAEFGLQFLFLDGISAGQRGTTAFGGTNFGGPGTNILQIAQNPATIGSGLNFGIAQGRITIGGQEILNLGLLARALETNASANILATPNLLTLDNEEARIIIGQNVPFITGQFTTAATGGASVNPFQTIERKDVGTTLRVRPQVSEGGVVKLQIFQEVSSVQDASLAAGLITNRRAIESNVLVDDGQVVVLGGLIEERIEGGASKVPGLGDVPVLGGLFRYDNRRRTKTNLLVFLRPVVVRSAEAAHGVTADRYDYIQAIQGDSRLPAHWLLPDLGTPRMPTMPPPPMPVAPGTPGQGVPGQGTQGHGMPGRGVPGQTAPAGDPGAQPGAAAPTSAAPLALPNGIIQTAPNEIVIQRRLASPQAANGVADPQGGAISTTPPAAAPQPAAPARSVRPQYRPVDPTYAPSGFSHSP